MKPNDVGLIYRYLVDNPGEMFVFKDEKAGMTFHEDHVFYVVGKFKRELGSDYNTHVLMMAIEGSMN